MNQTVKKFNTLINKIEIILKRQKLFSYPSYIQIEPTNRCNQRCVMCPRNDKLDVPIGDMNLEDFKKIINKLPTVRNLLLNGLGEPLLNKDLPRMINYASSRGINVSINSNCALINKSLAKELIKSGLVLIKISMDSSDSQVYQSIRRAPMEPVIRGIKNLVEAREEMKTQYPRLWFNSIIMRNNAKELIDILRLAEELRIDSVRFKPLDIWGMEHNKEMIVKKNELKKIIEKTLESAKNINVNHNLKKLLRDFDIYYRPKEKIPCYSPWTELYIQYYGGVRLCCEFFSQKYDIDNILKDNFKEIWNGPKMQQIRKEFIKGNTYFSVCQTCNRFQRNIRIYNKINKWTKGIKI